MKNNRGITLVALIVTIIVLLILAGITISLVIGDNGILNKVQKSEEEYIKAAIKEEMELGILDIQAELSQKNPPESLTKEAILDKLADRLNNTFTITDELDGEYKGYHYYIDDQYVVYIGDRSHNNITTKKNALLLDGQTYITTNVKQSDLIQGENPEFTIATSIYISEKSHIKTNQVSVFGDHASKSGFALQFDKDASTIVLVSSGERIRVDYTPYYDKYVDIVLTYNSGNYKLYFDKELVGTATSILVPYKKILLGSGYTVTDRTMRGKISSLKIWKKELTKENIENLQMLEDNTSIQSEYVVIQSIFDKKEDITKIGIINGSKYEFVDRKQKLEYVMKLNGGTYINTNITQAELMKNNSFTIAMRTKIDKQDQISKVSMCLFGDHASASGLALQFHNATTEIVLISSGGRIRVDYTPYYDKYVDIVLTYNSGNYKLYFDKELVGTSTSTLVPYKKILLGSGYTVSDRTIKGIIASTKIWKKELTESEVKSLNLMNRNNEYEPYKEYMFTEVKKLKDIEQIGSLIGGNISVLYVREI